ncbi:transporter [Halosquirtibacter xylanolyticus]|uniref:transporter n=1 Tax=Halosquirtibacter xylanolyticus TaxID=3374599 RepID=UPI0037491E24|nr:transporter [Prolixibacteraceae bacterium]
MKKIILLVIGMILSLGLIAQEDSGMSAAAEANNPLAKIKAFNVQFNFLTDIAGTDAKMNMTNVRYAQPIGRFLLRGTLPIMNSTVDGAQQSGLGDLNLFATYLLKTGATNIGFGPMATFPTGTNSMGADQYQVGAAFIAYIAKNPRFQWGGLVTWNIGVGDRSDGMTTYYGQEIDKQMNFVAVQPFYFFQLGKGNYLRGAPIWTIDLQKEVYNFPIGIGIGKIVKIGNTVANFFIEPQYSVYTEGYGAPVFQIFSSINLQFN